MIWLSSSHVLQLAREVLGPGATVRDHALLDGAVARARNAHDYLMAIDIFEVAAYYTAGIVKNHPFVDGNKRMGWAAAALFLAINGVTLDVHSNVTAADTVVGVADGSVSIARLAGFFSGCARKPKK